MSRSDSSNTEKSKEFLFLKKKKEVKERDDMWGGAMWPRLTKDHVRVRPSKKKKGM